MSGMVSYRRRGGSVQDVREDKRGMLYVVIMKHGSRERRIIHDHGREVA